MKKRLVTLIAVVMLVGAYAAPASAHVAGPCNDTNGDGSPSGQEYGIHHISAKAKGGTIGGGDHVPGTHKGFSFCIPTGKP